MVFIVFLRYVNAGEKNKVNMSVLRSQIAGIGYENVTTYINSGNVFIRTDDDITSVSDNLAQMLNEKYEFDIPFVIVTQEDYQSEILPEWWEKDITSLQNQEKSIRLRISACPRG